MTNHTPGPWYAEEQDYDSSSYYIRGSDNNGKRLTWGKGAVAHIPRSTVMPMEANAILIAEAPNLLAALCRIMDKLCPFTGTPSNKTLVEFWDSEKKNGRGEADDMLFALNTIAKAKGGAE